jgi:hypothetical protein
MSNVTAPTVIMLRAAPGDGLPHATADWNELEYWSCGADAVADLARRLLEDGYPANRGWELHDADGLLDAGGTLHQLYRPNSPSPPIGGEVAKSVLAPAPKPAPPAPRVQILPEPDTRGVLADGDYLFEITETSFRDNSSGTGNYVLVVLEGLDQAAGHEVVDYLNLINPSPWAVAQGKKRLKQICDALGIKQLTDTDQLLGQRLKVTLKGKADDSFGPYQVVRYARP